MDLILTIIAAIALFTKPFWIGFGEGIVDGLKNNSK